MHRLAGPVTLSPREVGRGTSVELGHRQHLGGRERVEVSCAGVGEEVFQPVPVRPPHGDEVFRSHGAET